MTLKFAWIAWLALSLIATVGLGYALPAPTGSTAVKEWSSTFLPGETTHGHYQIELKCQACHDRFGGVREESCNECHADALKEAKDTHPESKFRDPVNAALLTTIDARKCIACHTEHADNRTHAMGVSVPEDFCWQCHQDIAEQRPSHVGMEFNSCAAAGCHNFHDNRALYENFLSKHAGQPDHLDLQKNPPRKVVESTERSLTIADHDGPKGSDETHVADWAASQHARAGVNCSACHVPATSEGPSEDAWTNAVAISVCQSCHAENVDGFHSGKHGMRLASGLSPMLPSLARLAMTNSSAELELNCSACHSAHRANTTIAAAESCLRCHNDQHSLGWKESSHASLWENEISGAAAVNTGVSCATCHLPRSHDGVVEHNQNANLQPNEQMIRSVCQNCHGLKFSIDALADNELVKNCFNGDASKHIPSVDMAAAWFAEKERQRQERLSKRAKEKALKGKNL